MATQLESPAAVGTWPIPHGRVEFMKLRTEWMTRLAVQIGAAAMVIMFLNLGLVTLGAEDGEPQGGGQSPRDAARPDRGKSQSGRKDAPPQAQVDLGLLINDPGAFRGYTLLNPMKQNTTYLIDLEGRVVKTWESEHHSMHPAYLLENGHLFRVAGSPARNGPSAAGQARPGGSRSSTGTASSSGISSSTTRSNSPTTTSRSCPTATC